MGCGALDAGAALELATSRPGFRVGARRRTPGRGLLALGDAPRPGRGRRARRSRSRRSRDKHLGDPRLQGQGDGVVRAAGLARALRGVHVTGAKVHLYTASAGAPSPRPRTATRTQAGPGRSAALPHRQGQHKAYTSEAPSSEAKGRLRGGPSARQTPAGYCDNLFTSAYAGFESSFHMVRTPTARRPLTASLLWGSGWARSSRPDRFDTRAAAHVVQEADAPDRGRGVQLHRSGARNASGCSANPFPWTVWPVEDATCARLFRYPVGPPPVLATTSSQRSQRTIRRSRATAGPTRSRFARAIASARAHR